MRTKWTDLTPEEQQEARDLGIVNGIGAKDTKYITAFLNWIKPEWLTHASGEYHDWEYIVGGDEVHRYRADLYFYLLILQDAVQSSPSYLRMSMRIARAHIYYTAVRLAGYKRFFYVKPGEKPRTKDQIFTLARDKNNSL